MVSLCGLLSELGTELHSFLLGGEANSVLILRGSLPWGFSALDFS